MGSRADIVRARGLRATLAIAAAFAALAVVSGCGSSGTTTTGSAAPTTAGSTTVSSGSVGGSQEAWANDLCAALVSWQSSVRSIARTLQNGQLSKERLLHASDQLKAANTALASDLDTLGKPPTPAAEQARRTVQHLATQLNTATAHVRTAASNASDAASTGQAVAVAGRELTKMAGNVSTAARDLQSLEGQPSWNKAFSGAKSCKALKNS